MAVRDGVDESGGMDPRAADPARTATRARRRLVVAAIPALAAVVLGGCVSSPDDDVAAYVDRAIIEMRDGLHGDTPEFEDAVAVASAELTARETIDDTHAGLADLAVAAGGIHSFFLTPAEVVAWQSVDQPGATFPVPSVSTFDGISTVTLPSFRGQSVEAVERYRSAGLSAMRRASEATTCGWIVDLRTNGGGNAWPMLAVAAPLLDDGDVVGLRSREGETAWARIEGGGVVATPGGPGTETPGGFTIDAPVALLTSTATASAAEIVAIAFAGQADTVRVGAPTAGLTTGNEIRELSDGAWLVLTTSYDVDRTGRVYDGPLEPDVVAPPGSVPSDLERARDALRARCA